MFQLFENNSTNQQPQQQQQHHHHSSPPTSQCNSPTIETDEKQRRNRRLAQRTHKRKTSFLREDSNNGVYAVSPLPPPTTTTTTTPPRRSTRWRWCGSLRRCAFVAICTSVVCAYVFVCRGARRVDSSSRSRVLLQVPKEESDPIEEMAVYQSQESDSLRQSDVNRMRAMLFPPDEVSSSNNPPVRHEIFTLKEQREYLSRYGRQCYPHYSENVLLERYDGMSSRWNKLNLWKYCILYLEGGAFVHHETVLMQTYRDVFASKELHYAVLNSKQKTVHPSSTIVFSRRYSSVAAGMMRLLIETSDDGLETDPLSIEKELYLLISADLGFDGTQFPLRLGKNGDKWMLFELHCTKGTSITAASRSQSLQCALHNGYCCNVRSPNTSQDILLLTRHPHSPPDTPQTPANITLHNPTNTANPYISTISVQTFSKPPNHPTTPNMFEMLFQNDCLPFSRHYHKCLKSWKPDRGSCENCNEVCQCYCAALCNVVPETKFLKKIYWVDPPRYQKHPGRLIPRIVHQTWFEPVTKGKYPNMSRLIESWKNSGWEYVFYDDDASARYLSEHFPPEVREAYDSIIPGAFKADLFRYCVLFVHGGIYADMDVLLESNLDQIVTPDVGFLIPMDEPGTSINHRMCLWNGLLAASPGHPFLGRVIELVVNNIRNRFTGVDYDTMFCPDPVLSVSHTVDILFTTGPCILGSAVNDVLGRHMQTPHREGEIVSEDVVGKTVILRQDKNDMGAHRFTLVEGNSIVAATDMPGYEDQTEVETKHYSKTRVKAGIYGLEKLYVDDKIADEVIQIKIRR